MRILLSICAGLVALSGCAGVNQQMAFVSTQTVGLSVQGSVADNGAAFTLGVRNSDLAVMPAYAHEQNDEKSIRPIGSNTNGSENPTDSLSVFAQFGVEADSEVTQQVQVAAGVQKFFATGAAAQNISSGFACYLVVSALPQGTTLADFDPAECLPEAQD